MFRSRSAATDWEVSCHGLEGQPPRTRRLVSTDLEVTRNRLGRSGATDCVSALNIPFTRASRSLLLLLQSPDCVSFVKTCNFERLFNELFVLLSRNSISFHFIRCDVIFRLSKLARYHTYCWLVISVYLSSLPVATPERRPR